MFKILKTMLSSTDGPYPNHGLHPWPVWNVYALIQLMQGVFKTKATNSLFFLTFAHDI